MKIYGKEYSPSLYLPAPESKISAMEKNLGVSSLDDCSGLSIQENVQGLKNRLPCGISVRELNRFVRELQQTLDGTKEQLDKLFMALEAEAPASVDEAVRIARELEQYQVVLSPGEFHAPSDYAYKVLQDSETYYVDDFTADFVDYEALGRAMMREDGAVMTSFGMVVRDDHSIRLRPEESDQDFPSMLREVQEFISKEYSALLTSGETDEIKEQIKRYITKYVQDHRLAVKGMTATELVDAIYTEMAEFSFLTKYIYGEGIEEIEVDAAIHRPATMAEVSVLSLESLQFCPTTGQSQPQVLSSSAPRHVARPKLTSYYGIL